MRDLRSFLKKISCALVAVALAACGGAPSSITNGALPSAVSSLPGSNVEARRSRPIRHIVLMIQENRSFDDLFAKFPHADGATEGMMKTSSGKVERVRLHKVDLAGRCDYSHGWDNFVRDVDGGKMDGFGLEGGGRQCPGQAGTAPYQYVDPSQIKPYWQIAKTYVLADHMFQTQGSGSFTAHQDLIRGNTAINPQQTQSIVDFPSALPWGCDAAKGTTTSLLVWTSSQLRYEGGAGPFPCFTYKTLRDLLDAKHVSWTYYSPGEPHGLGAYWNAFDAIKAVREGSQWQKNVVDETEIFHDIDKGKLPAMSWLIPDELNSDHPGNGSDTGPSWVASVVNAIGETKYWDSTVVVVVWDDWGGFYDNKLPPLTDHWGGLGFRVPALIVSAYARSGSPGPGLVTHTRYEFGSILRFIEDTFRLGRLGTTDTRAESIGDSFDFTKPPRSFTPIASKYSREYFERQTPSGLPVDTQ